MKALVTGGTGFIGAYVTKALLEGGHSVVCFDLMPDGNSLDRVLAGCSRERLTVVAGDVSDPVALIRAAGTSGVDTIVHLAALLLVAADRDPVAAIRVNALGFLYTLEAARALSLRRVVWASSSTVYGDAKSYPHLDGVMLGDNELHSTSNVYGAIKSLDEFMSRHYATQFGVDSIGLRHAVVYGYARTRGLGGGIELFERAAIGRPATVDHGDALLTWIYVEDAAEAMVMAATTTNPRTKGRIYNTGGTLATPGDVAAIVRDLIPDVDITVRPGKLLGADLPTFDAARVATDLNFRPTHDLRSGVRAAVNAARGAAGLTPV